MKIKFTLILVAALAIAFFSAQSFYYSFSTTEKPLPKSWFKGPTVHAALCTPVYTGAEAVIDIPALKGWGNYTWKISTTSDSVQFYFNQGLSMYYSFHMIEAIASFSKATRIDPACRMAWYGKALAMGPTINYDNGYKPPSDAYSSATQSKLLATNCTPLEKDLINAIQYRYSADSTANITQLRKNYADAMHAVYLKYPNNADVLTLYADALMLLHPWDLYDHDFKPKSWTPLIRSLLEQALKISPQHPGANHYYIHTMEASATPEMALKSAHLLDTLMPQVSHITHMPSHIYIRTGFYQEGIADNNLAIAGYTAYLKQFAPVVNAAFLYEFHNIHLKINCAQMAGNYKIAAAASALLKSKTIDLLSAKGSDGNYAQYIYMQPIFTAIRFGKWEQVLKEQPVDTLIYASLLQHFARGIAYCGTGKPALAKLELAKLNERLKDKSLQTNMDNFSTYFQDARVGQLILQGVIAGSEKKYKTATALLNEAVIAEDDIIYDEPRDWPLPAREYLGNLLIKTGNYTDAIKVFKQDLVINPNNGWSLTGLKLAYQNTNNQTALAKVQEQLNKAWKIKDLPINRPVF